MEMNDEAFARMLQQQLLDEERMLMEQQQAQPEVQTAPHQGHGHDPYVQQQNQSQQRHSDSSNDRQDHDPYESQQDFDDRAYARRLQEQGFKKNQASGQSGPQPRETQPYGHMTRSRPEDEDDPDLALARRMQDLETMGMGNMNSQRFPVAAADSKQKTYDAGARATGRTRQEQEDEDSRLARLMAQSGQSLKDLNFGSKGKFPPDGTAARAVQAERPTPQLREHVNERDPMIPIIPAPTRKPPPQYSEPSHTPSAPHRSPQTSVHPTQGSQFNHPANMGVSPGNPVGYGEPRCRSQEFTPSLPERSPGNPTPYVPQQPPQFSGQRGFGEEPNLRQKAPAVSNREELAQRSPMRPPATRDDPLAAGRPPMSRDDPRGPASTPRGFDPSPLERGPLRSHISQGRGRVASAKRGGESGIAMRPSAAVIGEPPMVPTDAFLDVPTPAKKKEKKKKRGLLGIFGRNGDKETDATTKSTSTQKTEEGRGLFGRARRASGAKISIEGLDIKALDALSNVPGPTTTNSSGSQTTGDDDVVRFPIPDSVARPTDTIGAPKGPLPYSLTVSRDAPEIPEATIGRKPQLSLTRSSATCAICMRPAQNPLSALDKKYHKECFRCITCHELIDPTGAFAYIENHGEKQPMHRKCYAEIFGVKCAVCEESIPAGPDGKVSFVKHPFFDTEQMCPRHARNLTRRCTGCHRFEPESEPFADLNDVGRCVCLSCCRSVVVDSQDAQPLWAKVVDFFEHKLNMPIWKDFREVPILVVGYNALNDQMNSTSNVHGGASQIMTRGLCLTEHESGRRFRMNRMKFDNHNMSFVACDAGDRGFTFFQVPDASKVNPDASVTAILCLSGLPRDLSASVLAHEATHAWIKLHPRFDFERPIPPQVEEGCAQLLALLFLNEGLGPPEVLDNNDGTGPSDEKLRQYFKFSIETDDHEIYGTGYRRAAMAYSKIGIEALMSHVVLYQDFPEV